MRVASVMALLWTALGAADYMLTRLRVSAYLSYFDADQVALFTRTPAFIDIAWGVSIWAGLLGAMLWVLDKQAAVIWLALSMLGYFIMSIYFMISKSTELMAVAGVGGFVFVGALLIVSFGIYVVAREAKKAGYLS
ncbi:hypothetical protein [Litoreibacter meonggei]|nr:hypothetical protein [Litoreibacter meonggei]